jgi:hypothetical protein
MSIKYFDGERLISEIKKFPPHRIVCSTLIYTIRQSPPVPLGGHFFMNLIIITITGYREMIKRAEQIFLTLNRGNNNYSKFSWGGGG